MNIVSNKKTAIILSISSDIGASIAHDWLNRGYNVIGTYRTTSNALRALQDRGALCLYCDLNDDISIDEITAEITEILFKGWDVFVSAAGSQDPIGLFEFVNFTDWQKSVHANFLGQMRFLHGILAARNIESLHMPSAIFFAGPGTNNAPKRYSAYILSKIALIKAVELLDEEIVDTKFSIIGPGWVKTKTHDSTLHKYKEESGNNYALTCEKLAGSDCVPMDIVVACVNWAIEKDKKVLGGRNVSLVFDRWLEDELDQLLLNNESVYKLRRMGNELLPRNVPISEKNLEVMDGK